MTTPVPLPHLHPIGDESPAAAPARPVALGAALSAWLALVVAGFGLLEARSARPGATAGGDPRSERILAAVEPGEAGTVVMFVHPRCSCTPRKLEALAVALAGTEGVAATVLFTLPAGASEHWLDSPSWTIARSIDGADVRRDVEGRLAAAAGVASSGHTFVFDADGRLAFSGDVHSGSAHRSDVTGATALRSLLSGSGADAVVTSVTGCGLVTPAEDPILTHEEIVR